jgi:hypothetical protein
LRPGSFIVLLVENGRHGSDLLASIIGYINAFYLIALTAAVAVPLNLSNKKGVRMIPNFEPDDVFEQPLRGRAPTLGHRRDPARMVLHLAAVLSARRP